MIITRTGSAVIRAMLIVMVIFGVIISLASLGIIVGNGVRLV